MMNLTRVGYYKEMADGRPTDPSMKDAFFSIDDHLIDKICSYLDSGVPLIVSPGSVQDRIDESQADAGSPSILTDGKWAWSGTLSYYVKKYHLLLDPSFLDTMESNGWKNPIRETDLDYSLVRLDGEPLFS